MTSRTSRPTIRRARSVVEVSAGGDVRGGHLAAAHDRDPVGDGHHLAELVADEHDAASVRDHRPERPEQVVDLLRGEDGGRLVHDQDPRAAIEQLEDLDPLLLADRQLPDLGAGVDPQAEPRGQLADLGLRSLRAKPEARLGQAEQDVLGHGLRRDEREVLVDHAEPGRDRVARRAEGDRLAVEQDLAGIRPVQPGQDVHERALAGAVLAEQGVDLAACAGRSRRGRWRRRRGRP